MHIFAIIILFIIATTYPATEAQAGKYSNCLKCHKPSSISRDLRSTTKLLMRQALPRAASEVASQAARGAKSASDNTADALRILLQETADDDFINKPSVYAIIPDEETSYRKIYGVHDSVSVDPDELKGYEEDVFGLALTFRTKLYRPSDSDKGNKLIDYISDTKDTNIIIIGHNENGMLKLPSGDSIALQEVDDACTKHERNCIFISCNSDSWVESDLTINSKINFDEASDIAIELGSLIQSQGGNSTHPLSMKHGLINAVQSAKWTTKKEQIVDAAPYGASMMLVFGGTAVVNGKDTGSTDENK